MSAEGFNNVAGRYDKEFTNSEIGKRQRDLVYLHMTKLLDSSNTQNVLELNGGTGQDALWLAEKGLNVHYTDISPDMVEEARSKLSGYLEEENGMVSVEMLDIKNIKHFKGLKSYDLVFSNFGGFNCLSGEDLGAFFGEIGNHLSRQGKIVLVIMPKNCFWEDLFFILKRDWGKVGRRKKDYLMAQVGSEKVKTYYYNPKEIEPHLPHNYIVSAIVPIGLCLPPSYLEPLFKKRTWLLNLFYKLDAFARSFSFLARFSDHYLIEISKK